MSGLLDGDFIAGLVNQHLSPQLPPGTLRRLSGATANSLGDPVNTATTFTFRGFPDKISAFAKGRDGIPETDLKINIVAGSINTEPEREDEIQLKGKWYRVRKILEIDPVEALYVLQCYEIEGPSS